MPVVFCSTMSISSEVPIAATQSEPIATSVQTTADMLRTRILTSATIPASTNTYPAR